MRSPLPLRLVVSSTHAALQNPSCAFGAVPRRFTPIPDAPTRFSPLYEAYRQLLPSSSGLSRCPTRIGRGYRRSHEDERIPGVRQDLELEGGPSESAEGAAGVESGPGVSPSSGLRIDGHRARPELPAPKSIQGPAPARPGLAFALRSDREYLILRPLHGRHRIRRGQHLVDIQKNHELFPGRGEAGEKLVST